MFQLTLVTPDHTVVKKAELVEITLPAFNGELNILPGHTPLMTTLTTGRISYRLQSGEANEFVVAWGYCQVTDDEVLVLAENLLAKNQIDKVAVLNKLKNWDDRLQSEVLDDENYKKFLNETSHLRSQLEFSN